MRLQNQLASFRRAGCGVFFSVGDDRNRSFTLPGREQSNNGAGLLVAIAAMRVQDGNLEIRCDSECLVRVAIGLLQGERQLNNEGNADSWIEFETELRLRTTRRLHFVWVTGHATKVHSGVSSPLWTKGAMMLQTHQAAPQALTEAATKRQRVVLSTHMFVADLLLKRRDILLSMSEVAHG